MKQAAMQRIILFVGLLLINIDSGDCAILAKGDYKTTMTEIRYIKIENINIWPGSWGQWGSWTVCDPALDSGCGWGRRSRVRSPATDMETLDTVVTVVIPKTESRVNIVDLVNLKSLLISRT